MAKDYSKYNVEGVGEQLNKRKLVFKIVQDFVQKNDPSFDELLAQFPDSLQGSGMGMIRNGDSDFDSKRYFEERIELKDAIVAISSEWGVGNVGGFIEHATRLGYAITKTDSEAGPPPVGMSPSDLGAFVSDHCWELDLRPDTLSGWNKEWVNFLCICVESTDEKSPHMYMWLYTGGESPIAIAPVDGDSDTAETWFHNHTGCCRISDANWDVYLSSYEIMGFNHLPEKFMEGAKNHFGSDDDHWNFTLRVEDTDEWSLEGALPVGLSEGQLVQIVSPTAVAGINQAIAMGRGSRG